MATVRGGTPGQRFAFIACHGPEFGVRYLCQHLQVSRSGYYAWRRRPRCERSLQDGDLLRQIEHIFTHHRERYGSPRVHAVLRQQGVMVARKRVARLMRDNGMKARMSRLYKRHSAGVARSVALISNLRLSLPRPAGPNQHWASDVTYIRHGKSWRYLAVVVDLYSRRVIGWSLAKHRTSELTRAALMMALRRRTPHPGAIFHTDRGSEYRCSALQKLLATKQMRPSVNRAKHCTDNAEVESFFHTLKGELIHGTSFATDRDLRTQIRSYLNHYYNQKRLHSSLGYRSPDQYENLAA